MPCLIDLTGRRVGRLVVLYRNGTRQKAVLWRCRCDCGQERDVRSDSLIRKTACSCGCARIDAQRRNAVTKRLPPGTARFHQVLKHYQEGARARGISWDLTKEHARRLMGMNCHYCGRPPSRVSKALNGWWGEFTYNGIDRVNSKDGYTVINCVPCCSDCNYAKRHMPVGDFYAWIRAIIKHWTVTLPEERRRRRRARRRMMKAQGAA